MSGWKAGDPLERRPLQRPQDAGLSSRNSSSSPLPRARKEAEVRLEMRRSQAGSPPLGAHLCCPRHGRALGAGFRLVI